MKKVFITLILTVFMPATVLAFSDIPSDAWYRPYVDDLQGAGVIDAGEFFRPADSLNRAELVKLVIEATTGIEDYEAPPHPTFDDVPADAWFSPYVEEAATLGIVSGYMDETGSLTGMFGPADTVTRSAATKILVEAFGLEGEGSTPSFPDVKASDWFYGYVVTAYQAGLVQGYSNGHFGPNGAVSRAEIAKMISLAISPEDEEVTEPEDTPAEEEEEQPDEQVEIEEEVQGEVAAANPEGLTTSVTYAGQNEVLVGRYFFRANLEAFYVPTLTIVNDLTGSNMGDNAENSLAIKEVILKFPDENGYMSTARQPLGSNGKTRFSNLDYYIEKNQDSFFEIYVDLNDFSEIPGDVLSGSRFRLGIQNVGNTLNDAKAVGAVSDTTIVFGGGSSFQTSGSDIREFTVRRSRPVFTIDKTEGLLSNGTQQLIEFSIASGNNQSLGIARLTLEQYADAGLTISDYYLYRNDELVENVTISKNGNLLTLDFGFEESISPGSTNKYRLQANVSGVTSNSSINTRLSYADENTQLDDGTVAGMKSAGAQIIWSDRSASNHSFPTSEDFINGYKLSLSGLDACSLSK